MDTAHGKQAGSARGKHARPEMLPLSASGPVCGDKLSRVLMLERNRNSPATRPLSFPEYSWRTSGERVEPWRNEYAGYRML